MKNEIRWKPGMLVAVLLMVIPAEWARAGLDDDKDLQPVAGPDTDGRPPRGDRGDRDRPPGDEPMGMRPPGLGPEDGGEPPFFNRNPKRDWARVAKFLEEHFPDRADDLRRLEWDNPAKFRRNMREIMPRAIRLIDELERDEALGLLGVDQLRLELDIRQAARMYHRAQDEAKRQKIRAQIREWAEQLFDIQQKRTELAVDRAERRIERLKDHVQRRAERREELIAEDVESWLESPREPRDEPRGDRRGPRGGRGPDRRPGADRRP
ncbi:MAG: hypothetical protein GY778_12665 [bacterium]|nr:hypothetical protein [bacterium]